MGPEKVRSIFLLISIFAHATIYCRRLPLAANTDLVSFASGRLMLEYHEVNRARIIFAHSVHLGVVGWA